MSENGKLGEQYAADMLKKQGYTILTSNYSSRYGEIDIIASIGEFLAFIEVKTRNKSCNYAPCEAVDINKMRRITKTALIYLQEHSVNLQPRFDVIEIVTIDKNTFFVISYNHIVNAFDSVF